jgi:hypothetical protein
MRMMVTGIRNIAGSWALAMAGLMAVIFADFAWIAFSGFGVRFWDIYRNCMFYCEWWRLSLVRSVQHGTVARSHGDGLAPRAYDSARPEIKCGEPRPMTFPSLLAIRSPGDPQCLIS